jgi:hypothetical protein
MTAEGTSGRLRFVEFVASPFPYAGEVPGQSKPFLDVAAGDRRGHRSPRGGIYWEDETYSDRNVLLSIPAGFDPRRPGVIVVFFHGNKARLARDVVERQQVPRQVAQSGLNAVLVAPQFAVDALDSSAGRFWEPGFFAAFLDEAAERLTELAGRSELRPMFHRMPVVIVAYSGGYMPAAAVLAAGGANDRLAGVLLLDALYGEIDSFADWIARQKSSAFFFSAYSRSTRSENTTLQKTLDDRRIGFETRLPEHLRPGHVAFLAVGEEITHNDFLSRAWTVDPLKALLARLGGGN